GSAGWTSDETHEKIRLGGRLPQGRPARPAGRAPKAAQDDQGRRPRGDRGHQLRHPDVQASRHARGLRRVPGALQPVHEHRSREGLQEGACTVPNLQGDDSLHRRQAPPQGVSAEARQGARRAKRSQAVMTSHTHRAIEAVWRIESAKVIAGLTRMVGDLGLAEDLAQDALVAALERWPKSGVPSNPGAWLMATAKHRAIDVLRRQALHGRRREEIGREIEARLGTAVEDPDAALDDSIGDDLLGLMFTVCHPILSPEARVALTLRLLGGLTTAEIARAFLVPEPTVAQRIVRAKRVLAEAGVPFEIPRGPERDARLASVLEVI